MKQTKGITIVTAIVLGILTISGFVFQVVQYDKGITTQKEIALFNILQFILTLGFSWVSSRIISESEYFLRLKGVAISAYRRISDIESIVCRLRKKLNKPYNQYDSESIRAISSEIIEDLNLLIISSKSDWSDIIGDEIKTIEQIKILEKQKSEIDFQSIDEVSGIDNKIKEVEKQISELSKNLPPKLIARSILDSTDLHMTHSAQWMRDEHLKTNGLILDCRSGLDYGQIEELKKLKKGDLVFLRETNDRGISVVDNSNVRVGQAMNNSPLDYAGFENAFYRCYQSKNVSAQFIEITNDKAGRDGNLYSFIIKVISEPYQNETKKTNANK